jgi:hypothetical protein
LGFDVLLTEAGKSLWDYIRCFSQNCHVLPKICNADVISAFWSSMNYQTLVHELSRDQPKTIKELLDIATRHASGEEAIGAIFVQNCGKVALSGGRGALLKAVGKGTKRMMTRRSVTLMRSSSLPWSVTSSARCDIPLITLKIFLRQPAPIIHTLLGIS